VLRKNGGVNLRNPWGFCLSEVQTLVWIPLLLLAMWVVWRILLLIWFVITAPAAEEPFPKSHGMAQHRSVNGRHGN
jgi:hypothetical protein